MPRKQPLTRSRSSYSKDLKQRVIYQSFTLHKSSEEIALDLDMPLRVVQRVKQTWYETGDVCRRRAGGRRPLMSPLNCKYLVGILQHTPDLYLDEIQRALLDQHGLSISLASISRTLKRLGYSSKKLTRAASERSDEARRGFTLEIGAEDPRHLVFADESAVNILTTYRTNGWSLAGLRARKRCCFVRGTRYSILPAITLDGIIYSHIQKGAYNGEQFLEWLRGLLQVMNPYPAPQSILVLDNCRIHHVEGVEELCAERGVKLIYLPPYSPDYNPIEESFSFIKAFIRRYGDEFRTIAEGQDEMAPYLFLYHALDQVTRDHCIGWFHNSGYI